MNDHFLFIYRAPWPYALLFKGSKEPHSQDARARTEPNLSRRRRRLVLTQIYIYIVYLYYITCPMLLAGRIRPVHCLQRNRRAMLHMLSL